MILRTMIWPQTQYTWCLPTYVMNAVIKVYCKEEGNGVLIAEWWHVDLPRSWLPNFDFICFSFQINIKSLPRNLFKAVEFWWDYCLNAQQRWRINDENWILLKCWLSASNMYYISIEIMKTWVWNKYSVWWHHCLMMSYFDIIAIKF